MYNSLELTLTVDPRGDQLDAARECEAAVFLQAFGNTPEQWVDEYGPYDDTSVFVALSEPGGDVVAACRLLMPSDLGLKSLDDTARAPWFIDGYRSARAAGLDLTTTMDVATIGVRPQLRGAARVAASALYYAIGAVSRINELPNIVMIMDAHARRLLTSVGCLTHVLPGAHAGPYLGSEESTPLWMHIPSMFDNQRRINPDGFRLINQGVGLDGVRLPTTQDMTLGFGTPMMVRALLETA